MQISQETFHHKNSPDIVMLYHLLDYIPKYLACQKTENQSRKAGPSLELPVKY